MTQSIDSKNIVSTIIRAAILCCLVVVVILTGKFSDLMNAKGFVLVFVGGIALALMSFSFKEIGFALKHTSGQSGRVEEQQKACYFWETGVRNFWMMGVLVSVISFVIALGNSKGGIFGIATRMSSSYLPTIYGMIFAVICSVPALKISGVLTDQKKEYRQNAAVDSYNDQISFLRFEAVIGYVLFIFVLGWAIFTPLLGQSFEGPLKPQGLFLHWPSLLVVLGGTIAIVLFVGNASTGRSFTLGFALTGFLATLMGLVQAMFGFSSRGIEEIAAAITFILSACFVALLGMMLLGNPLEDRVVKTGKGQKPLALSRAAWFVFPFMTLIILFLTFAMVVTPIQKVGP
jgi:flagellar motor component MotA